MLRTGDLSGPLQITTNQSVNSSADCHAHGMNRTGTSRTSYLVPEPPDRLADEWSPDERLAREHALRCPGLVAIKVAVTKCLYTQTWV